MKRLATLVLVSGLLAGCNIPMITAGNNPVTTTGNQPVEPLGGVTFKPISAVNSRQIGSGGNVVAAGGGNLVSNNAAAPAAPSMAAGASARAGGISADAAMESGPIAKSAPMPAATSAPDGGAYSGNVWGGGGYSYGYYFGGYGGMNGGEEPMALVSITEAETGGAKGTFQDVVKTVAAPVIKAWAKDARLIQSNATLGNDGAVFNDPTMASPEFRKGGYDMYGGGYYGEAAGWRLNYLSPSRREALTFYVTAQKTLIIRMRWAPLNLAPELVTVDSASAIKKLIGAIEDKGFRGEEEKSGLDYFLGTAFDQPKTPGSDGNDMYHKAEVIYDVPEGARWNVSLQQVLGKMVWELSYYEVRSYAVPTTGGVVSAGTAVAVAEPAVVQKDTIKYTVQQAMAKPAIAPAVMPRPYPTTDGQPGEWRESYFENSARGMVDAQTGAVIRFSRPMKHFYRDYSYRPPVEVKPSPTPVPAKSTEPQASPAPTPTPGTTQGSTGTGSTGGNVVSNQ